MMNEWLEQLDENFFVGGVKRLVGWSSLFTWVSYAEARLSYRLDVRLSVCHTLVLYQNG